MFIFTLCVRKERFVKIQLLEKNFKNSTSLLKSLPLKDITQSITSKFAGILKKVQFLLNVIIFKCLILIPSLWSMPRGLHTVLYYFDWSLVWDTYQNVPDLFYIEFDSICLFSKYVNTEFQTTEKKNYKNSSFLLIDRCTLICLPSTILYIPQSC